MTELLNGSPDKGNCNMMRMTFTTMLFFGEEQLPPFLLLR